MGNCSALNHATAEQAARAYAACIGLDPEGIATPESAASAGQSFALTTPTGHLIYTVSHRAGCCWIHGAAGTGHGMTAAGLGVIEKRARAAGCERVAFQTVRPGLMRKAARLGYRITGQVGRGYTMEKTLK